jgi:flagellar hook-length control protein FliK
MEPEGDLTAFLHLDMEHLGSTDVSVRMHDKQVHTEFYLADDNAYRLLMEHMGQLQERLENKGYMCTIQVSNQEKKVDFVEDFLKKDQPATGKVHRYSFDVRA